MAKDNKNGGKVDVEAVLKKAHAFQTEAAAAIDALLQEKQEIRAKAEERCKLIDEQIMPLNELYRAGAGRYYVPVGKAENGKGGGERQRRSADQCKQEAQAIVAYLKAHPGSRGPDIKSKVADFGQSLKGFLEKYAPGTKIKTEGAKASTTYSLA